MEQDSSSWKAFLEKRRRPVPVPIPSVAAAAAGVDENSFYHTFIINAHGSIPDTRLISVLPDNVNMIKSSPGVGVPVVVSSQLFGHLVRNYLGPTKATGVLNFIREFYNKEEAEFYGNIYRPLSLYTDLEIEFKEQFKSEDDGDIVHLHPLAGFGKSIKWLREIKSLKDNIFWQGEFKRWL